jgi:type IV pilus assembly protein PilE
MKKNTLGFSLVELLVVVTIIGILAAIAYPNYRDYLTRSNRAAAKQLMLDLASRQEQIVLDQRSYTTSFTTLVSQFPSELNSKYTNPPTIVTSGNDCNGTALPSVGYRITLVAAGTQAADGNLCLDSMGNKTPAAKWAR